MSKLYVITLDLPELSHAEQAKIAISENVPLLQLRMKNASSEEIKQTIEAILPELEQSETKLIVNDHIEFLGATGVAGVHLGQEDLAIFSLDSAQDTAKENTKPERSRRQSNLSLRPFDMLKVTSSEKTEQNNVMLSLSKHEKGSQILGMTANTSEHIEIALKRGADYIGLGPFQYTTTKANLSKTLGSQGIKELTDKYIDRISIFAIGGITLENIAQLSELNLAGVAVSSAVFASENPRRAIHQFTQKLDAFAEALHA